MTDVLSVSATAIAVLGVLAVSVAGSVLLAALATVGVALAGPRGGAGSDDDQPPSWEPAAITKLAEWQPTAPVTSNARLRAYVWAGPMTFLGLVLAAVTRGSYNLSRDGLLITNARGPFAAQMRRQGYRAAALGHVVIARGEPSVSLLAHERLHTRQAERLGPLFGPVYLLLLAAYGYRRHPFERAARAAGRRARDEDG